jgi:glycosyltransferase involved in cell wall biosynthesis
MLGRTLRTLRREDEGDIEVIVVSDGPQPAAKAIVEKESSSWPSIMFVTGPRTNNWGNAQRMEGISRAAGDYLVFIDDDDVHRRGAFRNLRKAVARHPGRIIIFRMNRNGEILWRLPEICLENLGTPQILVPNLPDKLGSWVSPDRYESDFDFLNQCVELQGPPIWDDSVIALAPPLVLRVRKRLVLRNRVRRLLRFARQQLP